MVFSMLAGVTLAFSIIICMHRIGMRKFAGHPAIVDASVTLGIGLIMFGTFGGMIAAIFGGLVFSVYLTVYRKIFGYSRLTFKGWKQTRGKIHDFEDAFHSIRQAPYETK